MLLSLVLPAACGESGDDPAPSGGHPGQPETPGGNEGGDPGETSLKIGITVGSRTITATMEDNAAARDFLSRLPLEVTLSDYSNAEKIFYPSPALTTSKVARGCTPAPGDGRAKRVKNNLPLMPRRYFWQPDNLSNQSSIISRLLLWD